jgi:hypothetical protein
MSRPVAAIVRAEIWALTTWAAIALFAFASRMAPVEPGAMITLKQLGRSFAVNLAIQIPAVGTFLLIMRDLMGRS